MTLLILTPDMKTRSWVKHLGRQPDAPAIKVWPDTGPRQEVQLALVWKPPPGELARYPNLKCIASLGAGVDHLFEDPHLPQTVPITRVVHASMADSMSEYLIATILNHIRQLRQYRDDQQASDWHPRTPLLARDITVGIMGVGQLGSDAARKLRMLGFNIIGWRLSPKPLAGMTCHRGTDGLTPFLSDTNILICLLPLTPATRNILNRDTFAKLPPEAYVINAARGEHLVEADLLEALDTGRLSGAALDVFRTEPLPDTHPFWHHSGITVTPHISSITHPRLIAPQIVANYHRMRAGASLQHTVDRQKGY